MKIVASVGNPELATVYIADMGRGRFFEFVEACQPHFKRDERWILMVSTLFGCPVRCLMCDAGGTYKGKPTADEILAQIDFMVREHYPDGKVPSEKFKIQFARMGEPSLNMAVLDVLEQLPALYQAPRLMPSLSTIAPRGRDGFFERLLEVKNKLYSNGLFQFQFSIHTTDPVLRDRLMPVRKWDFGKMAEFGDRFRLEGDRKITLNFALAQGMPVDPEILRKYFDPEDYLIKITPLNPTVQAGLHGLLTQVDPARPDSAAGLREELSRAGYEVLVSIGEREENLIGSNCGQYVLNYLKNQVAVKDGYTYQVARNVSEISGGN